MPPKKMGRPPIENPKDETLRIRVDKKTLETLDECTKILKTTRSDIVRKGIVMVRDDLEKE